MLCIHFIDYDEIKILLYFPCGLLLDILKKLDRLLHCFIPLAQHTMTSPFGCWFLSAIMESQRAPKEFTPKKVEWKVCIVQRCDLHCARGLNAQFVTYLASTLCRFLVVTPCLLPFTDTSKGLHCTLLQMMAVGDNSKTNWFTVPSSTIGSKFWAS